MDSLVLDESSNESRRVRTDSRSLSQVATYGVAGAALASILNKVASFGAQFVLGWILSKDDFAIYAIAISTANLITVLADGGTQKILIQRSQDFWRLIGPVAQLSFIFNLAAAAVILGLAPVIAAAKTAPELTSVLCVIAASLLLKTPIMVLRAKLSIDLRFGAIAGVTSMASIIRNLSMVVFAVLGFGPLSFVLPLIVTGIYELIAFGRIAALRIRTIMNGRLTGAVFVEIFRDTRWIMVAAIASSLIIQGDYLILGAFGSKEILAVYFFGFQLTVAVSTLFTSGMQSVLMPAFGRLQSEPARRIAAYLKAITILALIVTPLCVLAALSSEPLIRLSWAGKWDAAIPIAQMLSLALAIRVLTPLGRALLEACGEWRLSSQLLWIDAIGTLLSAGIGLMTGTVFGLGAVMAIYRVFIGVVLLQVAGRAIGVERSQIWARLARPIGVSLLCGVLVFLGINSLELSEWNRLLLIVMTFGGLYSVCAWRLLRTQYAEVMQLLVSNKS